MNIPSGLGDALLNSASDAIIATDREGRIIVLESRRGADIRLHRGGSYPVNRST